MTQSEDIYAEIWRVANMLLSRAGIKKQDLRLQTSDLPTLYSLQMGLTRRRNFDKATIVSHEIVRRETENAREVHTPKSHSKSVIALVSLLRQIARPRRGMDRTARALSTGLVAGISTPKWLTQYVKNAPNLDKTADVTALTGLSLRDWNVFVARVVEATAERTKPVFSASGDLVPVDLNVAARLSRMAVRDQAVEGETPSYDLSDREIKVAHVTVAGFRGSAGTVSLDLTKSGKPADVLLWGDNGTGKSTLVDGIEFALQHRVDRSSDFNSSLRSSIRNLTETSAHAKVELSDGSVVSRSLVTNDAGRDEPSSSSVRPGFRIAPIVIRRADILRFLDTDALSRGAVFFDYFPDPTGVLGNRPDEELRQLEEEWFLLRVARDDLAAQLAERLPGVEIDFSDAGKLGAFVTELLSDTDTTGYEKPVDALPSELGPIIKELRSAQQRSSQIKKRLNLGVDTLNPIAYRAQLKRIVPILHATTSDLTASFKRITLAKHVQAVQVLVAKSGPASLDVVVEFDNGTTALPQQVFSEGYKDLIALLFFLAVTKKASEFGQAKVLVLDDALQSVDASIRLGVMDYILDEFKDWQLIVTGHDRAWFTPLRGLFQRRNRSFTERTIATWSFEDGIRLSGVSLSRAESLREAIERVDERMVASGAGVLLEEIANELSWRLNVSVTRREGDRYTLGDLWPGVAKVLKKTPLSDTVEAINMRLEIRNSLGAHYNEWADGIAWSDVRQLGEDVLEIYSLTFCQGCACWVTKAGSQIACRCRATVVS